MTSQEPILDRANVKPNIKPENATSTSIGANQGQACSALAASNQIVMKRLEPIIAENGCGIALPHEVSSVGGGVELSPSITVTCGLALKLHQWVNQVAKPFADNLPGSPELTSIITASSYVCRNRNDRPGTRLSRHATGEAIDIAAFHFSDGSKIAVTPKQRTGKLVESYQKAVRFGACLHFTTVLGPYSDPFHADHFHFDIAKRRSNYRLCDFPAVDKDKKE